MLPPHPPLRTFRGIHPAKIRLDTDWSVMQTGLVEIEIKYARSHYRGAPPHPALLEHRWAGRALHRPVLAVRSALSLRGTSPAEGLLRARRLDRLRHVGDHDWPHCRQPLAD